MSNLNPPIGRVIGTEDSTPLEFWVAVAEDSFLQLDLRQSSQDALLWLAADSNAVPPKGTPVTLVLRPAARPDYRVELDPRGDILLNGVPIAAPELALRLRLARRIDPDYQPALIDNALLAADRLRFRAALEIGP